MGIEAFESRRGFGVGLWLGIAGGVLCIAIGASERSAEWLVLSAAPFSVAASLGLARERPVRIEVDGDFVRVDRPPVEFSVEQIEGLTASGKPTANRFEIRVYHPEGRVRIPAKLDRPSCELYAILVSRMSPSGRRDVPPTLRAFRDEQTQKHGEENVFTFCARRFVAERRNRIGVAVTLGLAVGLTVSASLGLVVAANPGPFSGIVFAMAVVLGLFAFILWNEGPSRPKNWQESGIVIAPGGLALTQGELKGKMRWDELLRIDHPPRTGSIGTHRTHVSQAGVGLAVAGAYIVIADYYDRPPAMIYEQLVRHWQSVG